MEQQCQLLLTLQKLLDLYVGADLVADLRHYAKSEPDSAAAWGVGAELLCRRP